MILNPAVAESWRFPAPIALSDRELNLYATETKPLYFRPGSFLRDINLGYFYFADFRNGLNMLRLIVNYNDATKLAQYLTLIEVEKGELVAEQIDVNYQYLWCDNYLKTAKDANQSCYLPAGLLIKNQSTSSIVKYPGLGQSYLIHIATAKRNCGFLI